MNEYKYKTAAYLRLSKGDGDSDCSSKGESNSISNQRLIIERFLQDNEEFELVETYVVADPANGRLRLLTEIEAERLQGFDDDWTKNCLVDGEVVEMPKRMRYFCMGNALVVPMITRMGNILDKIIDNEGK